MHSLCYSPSHGSIKAAITLHSKPSPSHPQPQPIPPKKPQSITKLKIIPFYMSMFVKSDLVGKW